MILITGGSGQLGHALVAEATSQGLPTASFSRREWPIEDPEATERWLGAYPGALVINCAAYTAVDQAESDADSAFRVNSTAVGALYEACLAHDATLIHISSDFVFGRKSEAGCRPIAESAALDPEGVYASSKADGERRIIQQSGGDHSAMRHCLIVRTSWVFGANGKNFPATILRLAMEPERNEIRVVDDQIGRPTWTGRLARFLLSPGCRDLAAAKGGIVHFSNNGIASWFDLACATIEIGAEIGVLTRQPTVTPISSAEMKRPAPRPSFSVLDLRKAQSLLPEWPHWRTDLRTYIAEIRKSGELA